ncbi:hypothetical protein Nepgr_019050 [Nepenthes gracilis]|uniref:Uncharacterized protein n=1 Tax=Nepenthes gracilis TaxID=150966 RepID=A0AAD3SV19_NEPGR|nr:hypothetical protein Nepgr_019050 [Nepenthes gracilis]
MASLEAGLARIQTAGQGREHKRCRKLVIEAMSSLRTEFDQSLDVSPAARFCNGFPEETSVSNFCRVLFHVSEVTSHLCTF